MMSETILIEGPMHPDMFDGETPIMMPVKVDKLPHLYSVDVFMIIDETYIVCASDSEEARHIADEQFIGDHSIANTNELDTTAGLISPDHPKYRQLFNTHIHRYLEDHRVEEAA